MLVSPQLPLPLRTRLSYDPARFLLHEGTAELISLRDRIVAAQVEGLPHGGVVVVDAVARSGKTHGAVWLTSELVRSGWSVRWDEGDPEDLFRSFVGGDEVRVAVIDDADRVLTPALAGHLVAAWEKTRREPVWLLLLTSNRFTLGENPHIASRIRAATLVELAPPQSDYLPDIVREIARQRGIRLRAGDVSWLLRRSERSIAALERRIGRGIHLATVVGKRFKRAFLAAG